MQTNISIGRKKQSVRNIYISPVGNSCDIIGSVSLDISTAEILLITVEQEQRKRGIGSNLLNLAEELLRKQGHQKAFLLCYSVDKMQTQKYLQEWYKKKGYNSISYWWNPFKSNVLIKDL